MMRNAAGAATSGPPSVPGFEVLGPAGRGGMGEVHIARQLALGRRVAIKFLTLDADEPADVRIARFRREAELMAKVSHPNILSVYDFGEADGRPYLVLEYVEGGDLRRRMHAGEPMPPERVRAIVRPVGEALAYLHRQGILHRDLKPENILMHDETNPRVTDFGIAVLRAGAGGLTQTGRGLGTLGYIAPEQQYDLKVDERADQYSLAALSYELLTGQLPLGLFKPPSKLAPALGPAVDEAILRGLQESPTDRFPTILEFVSALDRALELPAPEPSPTPPPSPTPAAGPRVHPWLVGAGALSLMIVATALALRPPPPPPPPPPFFDGGRRPPGVEPAGSKAEAVGVKATEVHEPTKEEVRKVAEGPGPGLVPPPKKAESIKEKLTRIRANEIWLSQGSPEGEAGEAVREKNWLRACDEVQNELEKLAYGIWKERGEPEGEEAARENWHEAERRLLKKWKKRESQGH